MIVGDHLSDGFSSENQLTVNHTWYLNYLSKLSVNLVLKRHPLWASWRVSQYRLIHRMTHVLSGGRNV